MLRITLTGLLGLALNDLLATQTNFCSCHNSKIIDLVIIPHSTEKYRVTR